MDVARVARPWLVLIVFSGIVAAILVNELRHTPPVEHRERRIFAVAMGMLRSGDYLVPRLGTETRLTKPPLYYWLAAGIQRATTLGDRIAYRLPSILAALGLIACVFWCCRALGAHAIAVAAALTVPAVSIFYANARVANFDMLLSVLTFASAVARSPASSTAWNRARAASTASRISATACGGAGLPGSACGDDEALG